MDVVHFQMVVAPSMMYVSTSNSFYCFDVIYRRFGVSLQSRPDKYPIQLSCHYTFIWSRLYHPLCRPLGNHSANFGFILLIAMVVLNEFHNLDDLLFSKESKNAHFLVSSSNNYRYNIYLPM